MKNRIIQGFIEETRLNGIKFTMDDLAKRLGISKRTLYENFSSKLEILETIIDRTFSAHEEEARLIREDASLTLAEKIQQVILIIPKHNEFYDLRILEQLKRYYPEQWQRVDRELNRWEDLEELLREGMEAGIVKEQNMELLMKMILSAINITLDHKFFNDQSISMQEGVEAMSDVLLYGLIKEK